MRINRRTFHRQLGAAAAIMAGSSAIVRDLAQAFEPQSREAKNSDRGQHAPLIDTHVHVWNLERFALPWLDGAPAVLNRSYSPADYVQAAAGLNVERAVYMEVDVAEKDIAKEIEYAAEQLPAELSRAASKFKQPLQPAVGAIVSGRLEDANGFQKLAEQYKKHPNIKGVRQVLHAANRPRGLCLQKAFVTSVRHLGDLGLSFDLCMRPGELADAVRLAKQCRDTQFILDHCGNADPVAFLASAARGKAEPRHDAEQWKRDIGALAELPNVACKISGIVAGAPESWDSALLAPAINFCLDTFGPERVVFGGDWPVCLLRATLAEWVAALDEIIASRPAIEQQKLRSANAERIYRLKA